MKHLYMTTTAMFAMLFQQMALQQQLIEAQQQLADTRKEVVKAQRQTIALQKKLDKRTPKTPDDEEVFWHLAGGMMSLDAANSNDLATLRKFEAWLVDFGRAQIKPYVHHKAYTECSNQMTRGLTERIAELQTLEELGLTGIGKIAPPGEAAKSKSNGSLTVVRQ